MRRIAVLLLTIVLLAGCGKKGSDPEPPGPSPVNFAISSWAVNNTVSQVIQYNVNRTPVVKFRFGAAINRSTVAGNIVFKESSGTPVNYTVSYESADSVVLLQPSAALNYLTKYNVSVSNALRSTNGGFFTVPRILH
ncbi:MAG: Ig-like domain-containing protein [Bacteroidota bacterium]